MKATKTNKELKKEIFKASVKSYNEKHSVKVEYEDEENGIFTFVESFPSFDKAMEFALYTRDCVPGAVIEILHHGQKVNTSAWM